VFPQRPGVADGEAAGAVAADCALMKAITP
jgi:hypothetical protein